MAQLSIRAVNGEVALFGHIENGTIKKDFPIRLPEPVLDPPRSMDTKNMILILMHRTTCLQYPLDQARRRTFLIG